MTYKEWAGEYLKSAGILKEKIAALRKLVGKVPASEAAELDFRIRTMYMMYLDCKSTAELLMKRKEKPA